MKKRKKGVRTVQQNSLIFLEDGDDCNPLRPGTIIVEPGSMFHESACQEIRQRSEYNPKIVFLIFPNFLYYIPLQVKHKFGLSGSKD